MNAETNPSAQSAIPPPTLPYSIPPARIVLTQRRNWKNADAGGRTNYRVINHECEAENDLVAGGCARDGTPALLNRHLVEADVRIITGFIEPHFFADSAAHQGHHARLRGIENGNEQSRRKEHCDARSPFGVTEGTPLGGITRHRTAHRVEFFSNVTLNETRQITGVFAGDIYRRTKPVSSLCVSPMQKVDAPFEIVVTTNSCTPRYEFVSRRERHERRCAILTEGGLLILACECQEVFQRTVRWIDCYAARQVPGNSGDAGETRFCPPRTMAGADSGTDPRRAEVLLYSSFPDEWVRAAFLTPCHDIEKAVEERLHKLEIVRALLFCRKVR